MAEYFEYIEEQAQVKEEDPAMAESDIIGIANDMERNIREYAVFNPNAMNTWIIIPEIIVAQFEFKPMMFQMLQVIGQYSSSTNENPHLHQR